MNQPDPLANDDRRQSSPKNNPHESDSDHDSAMSPRGLKPSTARRIIRRLVFIPLIMIAGLFYLSMTSTRPTDLGVVNGMLAKCPSSPNCVSTQADDPDQQMPVIRYTSTADEMLEKIKQTIQTSFPRATLVSENAHYLHFEFKSLIFRFVDDVEFFVDDKASVVHFRSASRVGHSDMGANRKRMKQISQGLNP